MSYYPAQGGYAPQQSMGYGYGTAPQQGQGYPSQQYSSQAYGYPTQQQQQGGGYGGQQFSNSGQQFPSPPGQQFNNSPMQSVPYGYNNAQQGGYGGFGAPPSQQNGYPGSPPVPTYNGHPQGGPPLPPAQPQAFGGGAPNTHQFQYSNCKGKRKALLIGINYFGQRGQLRGCINDVKNMSTYLNKKFQYAREDMVILTDDQQNPLSQPTKANIYRAMHWLVKDAQPNDSLFFHYSGHGGQTPDLDGDEEDGYDEVIYPMDFREVGHIVDDEMHNIMVRSLPMGVRLTAIFDSCHSGSALDLPYVYSTAGVLKEPDLAREAGQGLLSIVSSYTRGDLGGIASTAMGFFKKATSGKSRETFERNKQTKTSGADVVMLSGGKDSETSKDAVIGGEATGAMSWAFINALKKNPQQSYVSLLNSIRSELETRYTQKPQLSCSHPLDTNVMFVM